MNTILKCQFFPHKIFFCSPMLSENENSTYGEICIKSSDNKPFVF